MKKACRKRLYDIPACILHGPGDGKQGAVSNPLFNTASFKGMCTGVRVPQLVLPRSTLICAVFSGIWDLPAKYEASKMSQKRWVELY